MSVLAILIISAVVYVNVGMYMHYETIQPYINKCKRHSWVPVQRLGLGDKLNCMHENMEWLVSGKLDIIDPILVFVLS